MKHYTRCLAALGLYAVSLLCLTDCRPASTLPVESPPLTSSWVSASTDSGQDALTSMPPSPEAELPLDTFPPETDFAPSGTSTSEMPPESSSAEAIPATFSPADLSPTIPPSTESVPAGSSSAEPVPSESAPTEPTPTEPAPSESAPTEPTPAESTPSESAPAEPTPTEPVPSESASTEPTPTEPAPTEPLPPEPPSQAPAPTPTLDRTNGQLAFQLQNELLVQNGGAPLQWSEALYEIAAERAEAISTEYSHAGCPDWVGENLLRGVISPDTAVQIWYGSDGHRQNMLAGWTYGAVANYGSYWAAVFAMTESP